VFIALAMLGLVMGTAALHRSLHGSLGLWPLSALLFVYNAALSWGFLNSLFGIGVYLFAFSAWVSARNKPIATRIAVFSLVAAFLFLCHLFAFGLYGLTVTAYEIEMRLVGRRPTFAELRALFLLGLHFVPALLLWAASTGGPTHIEYGSLSDKIHALLAPTTFVAQSPVVLDGVIGGLTIAFLYGALRSGSLKLASGMRLPMIALGLAAVLMPNVLDGSWLADIRLPVALPFIVIGATRLEVEARWRTALACIALVLLAARLWGVTNLWRDYDARTAELRAATAVIDRGARLLVVEDPIPSADQAVPFVPTALGERRDANFWHLAALAVIDRSTFIPYLFSGWTTIEPTARNAGLFETTGYPLPSALLLTSTTVAQMDAASRAPNMLGEMPYWGGWPQKFDFVLWIKFGPEPPPRLPQLQAVASGSFFYIYRVKGG